jgi:hypothetical protein
MKPNKVIKKLDGFHSKSNHPYLLEIPLGDTMFIWEVYSEVPTLPLYVEPIHTYGTIRVRLMNIVVGDKETFHTRLNNWFSNSHNKTRMRLRSTHDYGGTWDLFGCFVSVINSVTRLTDITEITVNFDHYHLNLNNTTHETI